MVVNLTENRFLQQAQKIEPPKKVTVAMKLSFIFEFLPVPFAFNASVLLWKTFSWCLPLKYKKGRHFS